MSKHSQVVKVKWSFKDPVVVVVDDGAQILPFSLQGRRQLFLNQVRANQQATAIIHPHRASIVAEEAQEKGEFI